LLFTIDRNSTATAAILAPDAKQWRVLPAVSGDSAKYIASGHLAFVEQATLFVVGFNPADGAVIGTAVPFANSVGASFDVSSDGTLAFRSSAADQSTLTVRGRIMLGGRAGAMSPVAPDELVTLEAGGGLAFAPDGERFMASMRHPDPTSTAQLWLYDLRKPGVRVRVTNQGMADMVAGRFASGLRLATRHAGDLRTVPRSRGAGEDCAEARGKKSVSSSLDARRRNSVCRVGRYGTRRYSGPGTQRVRCGAAGDVRG
jgi:hypothetical protein